MRRLAVVFILLTFILSGCGVGQKDAQVPTVNEQEIKTAITDLFNGLNSGNADIVKKYVGISAPVAEQLAEQLKGKVIVRDIRDINMQGTTVQATVTVEVVPLNIEKDATLTFNASDAVTLVNPLSLLTMFLQG